MIVLTTILGLSFPVAQAATNLNAPMEMVKADNPESEMQCLEAFVNSRFEYAHSFCLSLARQGMADAQLVTGLMYALGEGTTKNTDLAKLWLMEAMRNGSSDAKDALIEFKMLD